MRTSDFTERKKSSLCFDIKQKENRFKDAPGHHDARWSNLLFYKKVFYKKYWGVFGWIKREYSMIDVLKK